MSSICISKCLTRALLKKPYNVIKAETQSEKLKRHLSLIDLLSIGIGGTVGSGVFVLSGLIAKNYAGPGVVLSWLVAGVGCLFSAMSYAEFATVLNSAGSSYAYVYLTLGELPAVVAAWFLCLEYGISGAAVSRSWGDKVMNWSNSMGIAFWSLEGEGFLSSVNIFAGLLQAASVLLLVGEVEVGKMTIRIFTVIKILLVIFMIIAGLSLYEHKSIDDWTPKGVSGVFRGATSAFFGYLGYDEVCCLGGEATNPKRDIPRAIFGTITCVTLLYVLASLALVGMVPSDMIDEESGFAVAFQDRDWPSARFIVALGEIITLPLVVVISFLAQPRLLFAMAEDGLLPSLFAKVNARGNLFQGTLVAGAVCVVIALFIPFTHLDDMISAGVLLSFNLTNTSLVVLRRQNPRNPGACLKFLLWFNIFSLALALLCANMDFSHVTWWSYQVLVPWCVLVVCLVLGYAIATSCPEVECHSRDGVDRDAGAYRVPWMPFPPLMGIFINYFLIAQLSWSGLLLICVYTSLAIIFYFLYGIQHSRGNNTQWTRHLRTRSDEANDNEEDDDDARVPLKRISEEIEVPTGSWLEVDIPT